MKRGRRGDGNIFQKIEGGIWWLQYYVDGERRRESSESRNKTVAKDLLRDRIAKVKRHEPVIKTSELARIRDLYQTDSDKLKIRGEERKDRKFRWAHLEPVFGDVVANNLSSDHVDRYCLDRQESGAAAATINRELALLRHLMRLGLRSKPQRHVNPIVVELLPEDNVRTGFVEDDGFGKLCAACRLPEDLWLRTWLELAYTNPCRPRELFLVRCEQVDLQENVINLDGSQTKSGEPRTLGMSADLRALVVQNMVGKKPSDRLLARKTRRGANRPVVDHRDAWDRIRNVAGLPDLIMHDMRRSAAKRQTRIGIPQAEIMKNGGWETDAMFRRYNVQSLSTAKSTAAKIDEDNRRRIAEAKKRESEDLSLSLASIESESTPVRKERIQ